MDGIVVGIFLLAAFVGGFASGLAGFAMGFVVSGILLHVITPLNSSANALVAKRESAKTLDIRIRFIETSSEQA